MTITYQQAKRIRKTGWLDLLSDQLMYEKGIGSAISKTISLKSRSTMKGISQYFDPLNVARVLTFGSSIGPALLGNLTGRSASDIQYFSGRYKPIHEKRKTGDKLRRMPSEGGGFDQQTNVVLDKIYRLMANSYQKDLERLELAKNREEENQLEDDKKQKELLEALQGRTAPKAEKIKKTKDEEDDKKSWLESMISSITGFLEKMGVFAFGALLKKSFNTMFGWVTKIVSGATSGLGKALSVVSSFLFGIMRKSITSIVGILTNPKFLATAGAVALTDFALNLSKTRYNLERQLKSYDDDLDRLKKLKTAEESKPLHARRGGGFMPNQTLGRINEEIAKLTSERDKLAGRIQGLQDQESGLSGGLSEALDQTLKDFTGFSMKDESSRFSKISEALENLGDYLEMPSLDVENFEIKGGGFNWDKFSGRMSNINSQVDYESHARSGVGHTKGLLSEKEKTTTPPTQVQSPSISSESVSTPSIENQDTKLENKMTAVVPKTQTNNTNVSGGSDSIPLKRKVPSVRNTEETFESSIRSNTRLPLLE